MFTKSFLLLPLYVAMFCFPIVVLQGGKKQNAPPYRGGASTSGGEKYTTWKDKSIPKGSDEGKGKYSASTSGGDKYRQWEARWVFSNKRYSRATGKQIRTHILTTNTTNYNHKRHIATRACTNSRFGVGGIKNVSPTGVGEMCCFCMF